MTPEHELAIVRRAFAKQTMMLANVRNQRVEDAFATVRREDFLGPGPWQFMRVLWGYTPTPSADPVYLYCDSLFAIVPERGLNNGAPSLHAMLLGAVDPKPGSHIVHVGAGVGYYSAIMAELAGAGGRVTGIEYDPALAARAAANLASRAHVEVRAGDGAKLTPPNVDIIYVNAGTTGPVEAWLDALNDGGRLLVPITAYTGASDAYRGWAGAYFILERRGEEFAVIGALQTAIIPGDGLRDPALEEPLGAAFRDGRWHEVRRFVRRPAREDEKAFVSTEKWSLLY